MTCMGSEIDLRRLPSRSIRGSARLAVIVTRRSTRYARPVHGGRGRQLAGMIVAAAALILALPILLVVLAAAMLLAIVACTFLFFSLAVALAAVLVRRAAHGS